MVQIEYIRSGLQLPGGCLGEEWIHISINTQCLQIIGSPKHFVLIKLNTLSKVLNTVRQHRCFWQ
jgi:hypothetical protein